MENIRNSLYGTKPPVQMQNKVGVDTSELLTCISFLYVVLFVILTCNVSTMYLSLHACIVLNEISS